MKKPMHKPSDRRMKRLFRMVPLDIAKWLFPNAIFNGVLPNELEDEDDDEVLLRRYYTTLLCVESEYCYMWSSRSAASPNWRSACGNIMYEPHYSMAVRSGRASFIW